MTLEVTLPVAVDVEAPDRVSALNWIFPDRCMNGLPTPWNVAWKTNVNGQESRHQCFLSRVVDRSKPLFDFFTTALALIGLNIAILRLDTRTDRPYRASPLFPKSAGPTQANADQ
jgi:hypothetical protein